MINTSIIKVGYDCSLNMISNIGANKVQAGESDGAGGFYGINNYLPNLSVTNFDVKFNLKANGEPDTMPNTKKIGLMELALEEQVQIQEHHYLVMIIFSWQI